MQGKYIRTRIDDGVGYIEISKPKANTYDLEMMGELDVAIEEMRFECTCPAWIVSDLALRTRPSA